MTTMDDYFQHIAECELPQLRRRLAPLESGAMHLTEWRGTDEPVETTQRWATHLKHTIEIYEAILVRHRGESESG